MHYQLSFFFFFGRRGCECYGTLPTRQAARIFEILHSLLLQDSIDAGFTTKKLSTPSAHTFFSLLKKASPAFSFKLVNDMGDLAASQPTLGGATKESVYTSLSAARSLSLLQG